MFEEGILRTLLEYSLREECYEQSSWFVNYLGNRGERDLKSLV